ncbi:hypothetical protein [Neosynechococcus sphagnicola]|uniref:hypothetical protein n=1 Tax=Neosynechococcus sphagnicola TaxID=1501145 RepID=UPI001EF9CB48|nr:hypothetical protein [Neosynechococcus sphagnicola]
MFSAHSSGGLPLIDWITAAIAQQKLTQVGTGNLSVTAAFYHRGALGRNLSSSVRGIQGNCHGAAGTAVFPP